MKSISIGMMIRYAPEVDLRVKFSKAKELGLSSCQLCIWQPDIYTNDKAAEYVRNAISSEGFAVSAVWAGYDGPVEWNFTAGPETVGLVPPAYRDSRLKQLLAASDFAEKIGVDTIITHAGFIPENMSAPDFSGTMAAIRHIANYAKKKGQQFLFETGQETPVTLLRAIEVIGTGNVGINLDTANLILYGKANTLDSLDVFGKYVKNTHIKDGFYPTNGSELGKEAPAGEGKANIPAVIKKLIQLGYDGPFTIEREISGEKQIEDIIKARDLIIEALK